MLTVNAARPCWLIVYSVTQISPLPIRRRTVKPRWFPGVVSAQGLQIGTAQNGTAQNGADLSAGFRPRGCWT